MCVQAIDITASPTFGLWATSHTYPTCWSHQPTFADIQEPPNDLLRRRRPLPTSRSCRATSCGERPLAASDLFRRATSCGERPLAPSDLLRRATSCGERPLAASDLFRRATSCGERPLAPSDLLRRATSCGERPLAASDLSRLTSDDLYFDA